MVRIEPIIVGDIETNSYIIWNKDNSNCVIVDPGAEHEKIKNILKKYNLIPEAILLTHGHGDHISACNDFKVDVYIHKEDGMFLKDSGLNLSSFLNFSVIVKNKAIFFEDNEDLIFLKSGLKFHVIHTPGHTPGGACFLIGSDLFSGDTLFYEGVGRTDFPASSEKKIMESIEKRLFMLPDETKVYPGHGGSTTIGQEKKHNPFLTHG